MSNSPHPTPTILIRDLPPRTLVGIDLIAFTSAPNFHGIKDLTPGAHFLYTGTTESFSLRSGEWFFVGGASPANEVVSASYTDIRLRKWNNALETVVPTDESHDAGRQEAMQQRANLSRIWASGGLLAYQYRLNVNENETRRDENGETEAKNDTSATPGRGDWKQLTDSITPSLLNRILGPMVGGSEPEQLWRITSGSSAAADKDDIPGLTAAEIAGATQETGKQERELQFLSIDLKRTWREGAVGRERTDAAQDRSWALGELIKRAYTVNSVSDTDAGAFGEAQLLGELQFTFLMVLTVMNFSCLEQWKRLLGLIFTCRTAIREKEEFFVKVLRLLRLQLSHFDDVEGGLFEMDGDDGGAFLRHLLMKFKKNLNEADGTRPERAKAEFDKLEKWVSNEYKWELSRESIVRRGILELEDGEQVEMEVSGAEEEDETGDYAPVIVNLGDDNQPEESPPIGDSMLDNPSQDSTI